MFHWTNFSLIEIDCWKKKSQMQKIFIKRDFLFFFKNITLQRHVIKFLIQFWSRDKAVLNQFKIYCSTRVGSQVRNNVFSVVWDNFPRINLRQEKQVAKQNE